MAQKIHTFLMFEGRAEEAMAYYTSLFDDGEVLSVAHYGPDGPGKEGTVMHALFRLAGQEYMCVDSSQEHAFGFTPAVSLYVSCADEAEIDRLYQALAEQELMPLGGYGFSTKFGWVVDRFGVSWQLNLV
jgi:predicted 3-demethylubiquinone-9 3-methyltransferase (glyoxalase superfamily)